MRQDAFIAGIEALEALPAREQKITELEIKLREVANNPNAVALGVELDEALAQRDARIAELDRAVQVRDFRLEELEELCAQKDNALERISESLETANATCATLEREKADRAASLTAEISQSNAAEDSNSCDAGGAI